METSERKDKQKRVGGWLKGSAGWRRVVQGGSKGSGRRLKVVPKQHTSRCRPKIAGKNPNPKKKSVKSEKRSEKKGGESMGLIESNPIESD